MKEKILRETFRLLLEKGLYGVSVSDIQGAAGISRALIYHHFANKDDLFMRACTVYFIDRYVECDLPPSGKHPVWESFKMIAEARRRIAEELASSAGGARVFIQNYNILFYQASQKYAGLRIALEAALKKYAEIMRAAQRAGRIRKGISPDFLARLSFYVFDGVANYADDAGGLSVNAAMYSEFKRLYSLVKA